MFVGPTLPDAADTTVGSGLRLLPPVAAGDLLRLPLEAGDVVGIVDGYFHQARAIRHKEILEVLGRGVRVLGASSMGALRAAELDDFGMDGVGRIYQDYTAGILDADDEVTLLHGPAESAYPPFSVPLVNIRATLAMAISAGVCSAELADQIVSALTGIPYPKRSYQRVIAIGKDLGAEAETLTALRDFCATRAVDRKRTDALALVEALREEPWTPATAPPDRAVNRTLFLYAWLLEAKGGTGDEGSTWVSDIASLRACQLFATNYPTFQRRLVLKWLVKDCVAAGHLQGSVLRDDDRALLEGAIEHGVHEGLYATPSSDVAQDFLSPWLRPPELKLPPFRQLERFLVRSFRIAPGIVWDELPLAALRPRPEFAAARRLVRLAKKLNEEVTRRNPEFDIDKLASDRISDLFAQRWKVSISELEYAALDRGFDSLASMVASGRMFYLLARYNPEKTRISLEAK
jgi:hypothetical protein